ncbi:hypothetical protein ADUPG1_000831 [Aduncisulcus paluster]|uniref:Saposin B-type domain-containing protein n=1 Tax=Aduncisulcus paluster TaxID=2918883 RepID=A0ABQ5K9X5_9EUKA|nr:hypothetical protein ADUPG1_000831 [Aduncisulcus paluster]|eukprot:gnl/Carplike_NY0171/2562_a3441_816.p1 GENE.gnl/Carplike_NY0171/2562_a3441_816~~gnl/Carplike_NY0171/2562_a3441_816.p1  ORF type:complete len:121 (-),score=9.74 gnl/Carplike_NY0171/2562_a3441_816:163-525(-)
MRTFFIFSILICLITLVVSSEDFPIFEALTSPYVREKSGVLSCNSCLEIFQMVDFLIDSEYDKEEIAFFVSNHLCPDFSSSESQNNCEILVNAYTGDWVDFLVKYGFEPHEVCSLFKMCD